MPISEEDQARYLRDLYVRKTTSSNVYATYPKWEEVPQLTRDAWLEVYRAVYENHPDKERMDWLEREPEREEKAKHLGKLQRSVFRENTPITRELVDSFMGVPWCEACQSYHDILNPTCIKEKTNDASN